VQGGEAVAFPRNTAIGALMRYISEGERREFQPMNISFGLLESYHQMFEKTAKRKLSKKDRRLKTAEQALEEIEHFAIELEQRRNA